MKRLTTRDQGLIIKCVGCKYENQCISEMICSEEVDEVSKKLKYYEDLEEQLQHVYGECDGLLEKVISSLIRHEGTEIGTPKKARLLTDEDVDKWEELKNAEEQGLLLRLPCKVINAIDRLFSHNEIVSLWIKVKEEITYHQLVWSGEAWRIPEELKNCDFVKIFGTIPQKIAQADRINVEIVLTEEAEQALTRIEKENER